eukprot:1852673-Amphidinium_carterae.1
MRMSELAAFVEQLDAAQEQPEDHVATDSQVATLRAELAEVKASASKNAHAAKVSSELADSRVAELKAQLQRVRESTWQEAESEEKHASELKSELGSLRIEIFEEKCRLNQQLEDCEDEAQKQQLELRRSEARQVAEAKNR